MIAKDRGQLRFLEPERAVGIVAVGFSGGQGRPGVDAAPEALLNAGLCTALEEELEYQICFDGIVHNYRELIRDEEVVVANMRRPRSVSAVTQRIAEQVHDHARQGRFVLNLGGDHSIAIGTIAGAARGVRERIQKDMAVIWVDAHADINTPESSPSGNIHGMPLAFLTGIARSRQEYGGAFDWIGDEHRIHPSKLVYIGLRDVDRGERDILRKHGILAFSMYHVDRYGIGAVMDKALAHIGSDIPIYLSFDVDALDPSVAPSTGTPVRGGLTLREGNFICEAICETGQLVGMDLVEVNPHLSASDVEETIRVGSSLVRCALGESLL